MEQGDGTSGSPRSTGRPAPARLAFALVAALAAFLSSQIGCKEPENPRVTRVTHPERPFLYEAEFARDPHLAALPHQVVIHDLEPSGSTGLVENVSQHALDRGSYRFCIAPADPWVRQLTLDDENGKRRVALDAGSNCADLQLDTGTYRLALLHDGKTIAGPDRVAFVRRLGATPPPLVDDAGQPQLGWWALAPDDPTGQGRAGRLRAQSTPTSWPVYGSVLPVIADFSSRQVDAYALFDFQFLGGNAPGGPVPELLAQNTPLDVTVNDGQPTSTLIANPQGVSAFNKFGFNALQLTDLGNQKVLFQVADAFLNVSPFWIDESAGGDVRWYGQPANVPGLEALVLFRMYRPGDPNLSQLVLEAGQVALYTACNFGGQVTVFALDTADFSALTSSDFPIDRNTASVQVGPGTAALLYGDAGFTGTLQGVETNTACLDGTPIGRGTRSLQIRSQLQAFFATSSCEGCNLAGVDLTDAGVSGADLTNASLQGATLNHTDLSGARSLAGTDFSGATITCSNFAGAPGSLVDLTATKMLTAIFTNDLPGCRTNLSSTKVSIRSVPATALKQGNLAGSTIDFADAGLSTLQGVSWPGATLQNAAFSGGVDFSGSDLTGVHFLNTAFGPGCSPGSCSVSFQGTTLDGVVGLKVTGTGQPQDFTNANFSQASLGCVQDGGAQCVDLGGTALAGAQFVGSTLVGTTLGVSLPDANFTGATLNGVSGLAGADLQGAVFAGATMPGLDLSGAMLDSADFSGAVVDAGSFVNATGLGTLIVKGADLTLAQFGGPGLVGASLEGATLDGAGFDAGDMSGITFSNSSLIGVDLSQRALYGAKFVRANLTNANLEGSALTNNPDGGSVAADFTGAHLKDVNLSNSQLQGTTFSYASLYGSFNLLANGPPVFPCVTNTNACGSSAPTGFTCSCATVAGAAITRTNFENAFLYGLDFGGNATVVNGADFTNALLVGANFKQTTFQTDSNEGGAQPVFNGAFLQGADLSSASLDSTSLENAYVDFEPNGNEIQVVLGAQYLQFKGWSGSTTSVCVQMAYDGFVTQVPVTTSNTTCPDGFTHNGGCGPAQPRPNANPAWDAGITVDLAPTPGAYLYDATYAQGNQDGGCNLNTANFDW